ncbi:MAG: GH3 auxin-responsive promoter family protein [bacterium]
MKKHILKILTRLKMMYIKRFLWQPLIDRTHNPEKSQNNLLMQILRKNQSTEFGRKHGFDRINSYDDFKSRVPVCEYETLRNYIEDQEKDKHPYLNFEQPVMYVQTSGTTDKPKLIPVLNSTIHQYRKCQHIVAYGVYASFPEAYDGKVLAITSPAIEGVTESGSSYGAMSGLIYKSMPLLTRAKYVLPSSIFEIDDYEKKYFDIAKLALAEKDITMIATANPSTLIKLERTLNQDPNRIITEVSLINPVRGDELRHIYSAHNRLKFSHVWPNLKVITTWTGGNCGVLIPTLRKTISNTTRFVELGYLASEFRGGITIDAVNNRQIPCLHENFYEFVDRNDWENSNPRFLTLSEIRPDRQYYIFVTTHNGLYRYHINDLVEVTGWFNDTPTIQFLQKGKGVINLTGEKLCENQLIQAMTHIAESKQIELGFFVMLGCAKELRYTLYVESQDLDVYTLERHIAELNIEFKDKRKSNRLKPIKVVYLEEGTGEAYKKHCLNNGQREGQFKMLYLQYKNQCEFDFAAYAKEERYAAA